MSLDGRTATAPGDSPWISGEQSRELVHRWRAESDAIAVGIGTVLADDPLLTARVPGARQPLRVVFDRQARLPLDSQLLATLDQAPVLVVVSPDADRDRVSALRDAGAEILVGRRDHRARRRSRELGRRDITSLFLEGGRDARRRLRRGRPDRRGADLRRPRPARRRADPRGGCLRRQDPGA